MNSAPQSHSQGVQLPSFTLGMLAQVLQGTVHGDAELTLSGFNPAPEQAQSHEFCFVFSKKYLELLQTGKLNAGAYLVPQEAASNLEVNCVAVAKPKLAIKKLLELYAPPRHSFPAEVHPTTVLAEGVTLGQRVRIGPQVYIGPGCTIGDGTQIFPGCYLGAKVHIGSDCLLRARVVIEDRCRLGDRVIVQPGAVIGGDGFSYVTERDTNFERLQKMQSLNLDKLMQQEDNPSPNPLQKVPAAGWVEIADDVEIGANSCVDRGTLGPTVIGQGSKIDNLVQVAHNVQIGAECLIAGQTGLGGSAVLEDRVVIAGHAGCRDNIRIQQDSILMAASHAHKDTPPYSLLGGNPAIPVKDYLEKERTIRRANRELNRLKERLQELEEKLEGSSGLFPQ